MKWIKFNNVAIQFVSIEYQFNVKYTTPNFQYPIQILHFA